MEDNIKGYDLLRSILQSDENFNRIFRENLGNKIRFFDEREWSKIDSQNYASIIPGVNNLRDVFELGYNIGDCVGISTALSYSYDDVDMVAGTVEMLKGTKNAEKEGGHRWLETPREVIDTSLMLVFDKSLKRVLGYREEMRLTADALKRNPLYQTRKEFVNDPSIRASKKEHI